MDAERAELMLREVDLRIKGMLDATGLLYELRGYFAALTNRRIQENSAEIASLKKHIVLMQEQLERVGAPQIDVYERNLRFIHTKLVDQTWPKAVDDAMIVKTPEQKRFRAETIIDLLIPEYLKDMHFLDVGCGDGLVVKVAHERGARVAVGYDVDESIRWNTGNNPHGQLVLTHQIKDLFPNQPYDIVLMYDMLDHSSVDPVELLTSLKDVLSDRGRVYLRTHPWCSRHGAHLYEKINKAYLHLILDDVELTRIGGYSHPHVRKIIYPLETYRSWFAQAGYRLVDETICRSEVEPFFFDNNNLAIRERIEKHWCGNDPAPHMAIEYVDYLIEADRSQQIV